MPTTARRTAAVMLALGLFASTAACRQPSRDLDSVAGTPAADTFRRSDPSTAGTTGRPQLVEFYHPT